MVPAKCPVPSEAQKVQPPVPLEPSLLGAGEAALKRKLYNFFTEILLEICAY